MSRTDKHKRYRLALGTGLAALVLLSALGAAAMLFGLQVNAWAQAYMAGESHWSKGVGSAVYYLDRYAEYGREEHLAAARAGLSVPLGDLQARRALEQTPPDLETGFAGFLAGRNAPEGIPGMIRLFLHFAWAPGFAEAVQVWRASDVHILRLEAISHNLAAEHAGASPDPRVIEALRVEIDTISRAAFALAERFSSAMLLGVDVIRNVLYAMVVVLAAGFVAVSFLIFWRMMEWLRQRDRRFHAAFEQAGVGMAQVDLDGYIGDVNQILCETLMMTRSRMIGLHFSAIVYADDLEASVAEKRELLEGDADSFTSKKRYVRGDGRTIWAKLTAAVIRDEGDRAEQFLWIFEDVTDSHELSEQLSYQARHDELTGLLNRRELECRLDLAVKGAHRDTVTHVLCFIDLDQFKLINDSCGHIAGDQLLRSVAQAISSNTRDADVLGRIGGDEFAIILHKVGLEGGLRVGEKLRETISDMVFRWDGKSFRLTISIGLVEINERTTNVTAILSAADTACKIAKNLGRNRVHAFTESDEAVAAHMRVVEWHANLREALSERRLVLHAQCLLPLGGQEEGLTYEILTRLRDKSGAEILPGAFLPAAERYGLITEFDCQVLEHLVEFLRENPGHLKRMKCCHVNVSAQSVGSETYRNFVRDTLVREGLPRGKLCFEVTETAVMTDMAGAKAFFELTAELGCLIAIDDFGSGMSSFGYLKSLPAQILKIDGVFIRDIADDVCDQAVVQAIREVASQLGKATVAEFVESDEALDVIRRIGVDYAQGYAIHRPEPLLGLLGRELTVLSGHRP